MLTHRLLHLLNHAGIPLGTEKKYARQVYMPAGTLKTEHMSEPKAAVQGCQHPFAWLCKQQSKGM